MRTPLLLSALTALSLGACGDASFMSEDDRAPNLPGGSTDTLNPDGSNSDASGPPEPEDEQDFDLRTPEAGQSFLYIPSRALDALVVVDARTLTVELVEVGLAPTIARALPNDAGAVVLNEGSNELSVVRRDPTTHAFTVATVPVLAGANQLKLSPDASFAFVWYSPTDSLPATGSLQDVTAVALTPEVPLAVNLAVGLRPSDILFAANDTLALIVCEDGLSTIRLADLTSDAFLPPIPTSPDPFEDARDRELVPSADGAFVYVRSLYRQAIGRIDLTARTLTLLDLPAFPTDLDLTAAGDTLLVMLKGAQSLALIDVPAAFTWAPEPPTEPDPDPNPGEGNEDPGNNEPPADPPVDPPVNPFITFVALGAPLGSAALTADDHHALLYTTAAGVTTLGLIDLDTLTLRLQPTPKEIEAVIPAPNGKTAALLYRTSSGNGDLATRPGYALFDLTTGYSKLILTPFPTTLVSFSPDSAELIVLVPGLMGGAHEVQRVKTASFTTLSTPLPDRPVFIGALPSLSKIAISLDNPTGWVTFIDTQSDAVFQLNSFELNSFIR